MPVSVPLSLPVCSKCGMIMVPIESPVDGLGGRLKYFTCSQGHEGKVCYLPEETHGIATDFGRIHRCVVCSSLDMELVDSTENGRGGLSVSTVCLDCGQRRSYGVLPGKLVGLLKYNRGQK